MRTYTIFVCAKCGRIENRDFGPVQHDLLSDRGWPVGRCEGAIERLVVTPSDWLDAAESVLREIHDNSKQIDDPHFRHWAAATVGSYFSAKAAE